MWRKFQTDPPPSGTSVVILDGDNCSSVLSHVVLAEDGVGLIVLDAEDGSDLSRLPFLTDALWAELPEDYRLAFTQ